MKSNPITFCIRVDRIQHESMLIPSALRNSAFWAHVRQLHGFWGYSATRSPPVRARNLSPFSENRNVGPIKKTYILHLRSCIHSAGNLDKAAVAWEGGLRRLEAGGVFAGELG